MSRENRDRMRKIRREFELKKMMESHPDWCYCEELGVEPVINESNVIGYTEPVDGFPYWNSTNYSTPIYICENCGKKYTTKLAF